MRIFAAAIAAVIVTACPAIGAEAYPASPERSEWFKGLISPTGVSCCDVSDCRRTKAEWRDGRWHADVFGVRMAIPPEKVLSRKSIDGDAYVCANPTSRAIYCFVPPDMGF